MKASTIFLSAFLAASAMALPTTLQKRIDEQQVFNSINAWINNVDNVNSFLDAPVGQSPSELQSAAQTALDNANDEPIQLQILSDVNNLDSDGLSAVNTLMRVFGNVITQLQNIINSPDEVDAVNNAISSINDTRCKFVLPSVTQLWASAAQAVGAPPPPAASIPNACQTVSKN
ncbi:hypothetical protein B7463_g9415, partial [Scytalidium lignicola]